mmetsp:Transcript_32897/g.40676  ORF Transcript_32897/g.40676 Transcript_32897/m.40676 type:complete len:143 (+) Transcript_32897:416-844(+)
MYQPDFLALKNLVCAPLFEEVIYRVCLINMFVESGALNVSYSVVLLPFFFAISHLHHVFDQKRTQDKRAKELAKVKENMSVYAEYMSYKKAIVVSLFRLAYTQIFGIYSGFIYVNTGSLWPAVALHAQCNFFGFPTFENLMN